MFALPAVLAVRAALRGFAGIAVGLTLLALVCAAFAVVALWRMRQEYRQIEAAERFEAIDLTDVVKKYVPGEFQSHRLSEELPIVRAAIGARWPKWKWTAIVAAVVMLGTGSAASLLIHRNMKPKEVAPVVVEKQPVKLDVLKAVQGVWGMKFNFLQSCEQNPQMIMVSPDRKKLLVHYVKPAADGSAVDINYNVVSTAPDALVLVPAIIDTTSGKTSSLVHMTFEDADTYDLRSGDNPLAPIDVVVRCP